MRAYSTDLRTRVVNAAQTGKPLSEVAKTFGVSVSTIKRYLDLVDRGGNDNLRPKTSPGRPRRISREDQADLIAQLEASPDATLEEHCAAWEKSHRVRLSIATMHRSIARAKYTLKRKR